ncbi:MAG: YdcF family protein [Pseudomonadota bacterium]|nr:YdcF family protein [Pseudomonadota bacterium]
MFFYLSKVLWFFVDPGNLIIIGLCIGAILLWTRWQSIGKVLICVTAIFGAGVAVVPVGALLTNILENRFPGNIALPEKVNGIIVLGGVIDQFISKDRETPAINGAVERLIAFAKLSERYPEAKLIFSGGSGVLTKQNLKEAHFVGPVFEMLNVDMTRIIYEDKSKNTFENALFSKELVESEIMHPWVLVTSAFHMPRAIGVFRHTGWNIFPYPVDYQSKKSYKVCCQFSFRGGISSLSHSLHEWIGLGFYWLTNRTNEFFPRPAMR